MAQPFFSHGHNFTPLRVDFHNKKIRAGFNPFLTNLGFEQLRVFGAGKLLFKNMKAESVVNALIQNAPDILLSFHEYRSAPSFCAFHRGSHSSRPSADHECVCRHLFHSLTIPRRISVFPDRILISPSDRPDSRANISAIFAKQNPP